MRDVLLGQPQLVTSSRLLRLGESLEFCLHAPPRAVSGDLTLFPRYLEQADPGDDAGMRSFVERYQRLVAFDFPKRHRNLQGECHLVLRFDLKPGAEILVRLSRR
jgi:hypothetical protein